MVIVEAALSLSAPQSRGSSTHRLLWELAVLVAAAVSIAAAAQAPPAPPQAPAAPQPRFVVVLDAAHGGDDDPGGHLDTQAEKAYTLALSVKLRSLLNARGIQVVTTRESDANVDTNRRAEIANHANAQACLSLHASQTGSGVHLFASSLPPAPPTRFPAWRTGQSAFITRSLAMAGILNSALQHAGIAVTLGRTAMPAVDSMTCPAIAIEIAPDRATDHAAGSAAKASLDDPVYQARVAEAIAAAMLEWKTEVRQP